MGSVQIVATVLAAAVTLVAVVLAVRAVRQMIAVDPARASPTRPASTDKGTRTATMLPETARPHPDAQVERGRRRALVRDGRASSSCPCWCSRRTSRSSTPTASLPIIGGWAVVRPGHRVDRRPRPGRHPGADRDPAAQPADRAGAAGPGSPARRCGRPTSSSAIIVGVLICGFLIRGFKVATGHFEYPVWATPVTHARRRAAAGQRADGDHHRRAGQDRHLDGLADRHRAERHDGRGLAPVPRVPQHLLQARRRPAPAGARRAAADDVAAASRSTSRRPTRRRTRSASPRSSSSPGRACSTSPPAPSAAAASRSARPGTPASRCRRSCWSCRCATTRTPRRRTCSPAAART